jgi:hypothetical protein
LSCCTSPSSGWRRFQHGCYGALKRLLRTGRLVRRRVAVALGRCLSARCHSRGQEVRGLFLPAVPALLLAASAVGHGPGAEENDFLLSAPVPQHPVGHSRAGFFGWPTLPIRWQLITRWSAAADGGAGAARRLGRRHGAAGRWLADTQLDASARAAIAPPRAGPFFPAVLVDGLTTRLRPTTRSPPRRPRLTRPGRGLDQVELLRSFRFGGLEQALSPRQSATRCRAATTVRAGRRRAAGPGCSGPRGK